MHILLFLLHHCAILLIVGKIRWESFFLRFCCPSIFDVDFWFISSIGIQVSADQVTEITSGSFSAMYVIASWKSTQGLPFHSV